MQGTIQQSITVQAMTVDELAKRDDAVCEEFGCEEDATTFNADELAFLCDEHEAEVAG